MTIAVRLLPDVFAPDQLYTTSVVVKGYDGLELLLTRLGRAGAWH